MIDGANRFEALRRLGARAVPCVVYDYSDIDLLGNVHFINNGMKTRLSEFAREQGERIEFPRRTPADIRAAAENGQLVPNGETFHRVPQSVVRLPIPLDALTLETAVRPGGIHRSVASAKGRSASISPASTSAMSGRRLS